jgi:hypothetical protein
MSRLTSLNSEVSRIKEMLGDKNVLEISIKTAVDVYDHILTAENLTKRHLETVVDKIVIFQGGRVDFYLKDDLMSVIGDKVT